MEPPSASWLYEPFPAPDFALPDLGAARRRSSPPSRPAGAARSSGRRRPRRRARLSQELRAAARRSREAGVATWPWPWMRRQSEPKVRAAARGLVGCPSRWGARRSATTYTLLHRYLFVGQEDLPLPTAFLLDDRGRDRHAPIATASTPRQVVADVARISAPPAERLARAMPFPGTLARDAGPAELPAVRPRARRAGARERGAPAFERAAKGDPSAFTLYSLGALYVKGGQPERARAAFERALQVKPDFSEASNGLGALVAQGGNVPGAIALFRIALETTPDYPDALNNLGYALLQIEPGPGGPRAVPASARAAARLPRGVQQPRHLLRAAGGDRPQAESYFRQAVDKRPGYGEAANNLALVLMARDDVEGATAVLQRLLRENPDFEMTYVTLVEDLPEHRTGSAKACRSSSGCCRRTPAIRSPCR